VEIGERMGTSTGTEISSEIDADKEIHKPRMMAVIPTDVQCIIGILASDLKKVHKAMQLCTNSKPLVNDADRDAWQYFAGPFFEFIDHSLKEIEDGPDGE